MGWFLAKRDDPPAVFMPSRLRIAALIALLCLPLDLDAADEMKGQQRKNYAAAPIVVSNPAIGTGAGATGMLFYDVGSERDSQPRSSVQLVGAYTNTDSYFVGLLNSLHLLQDQVRSKAGLFHARINNDQKINFRVDAAVGNGDNKGIYVGIREAF